MPHDNAENYVKQKEGSNHFWNLIPHFFHQIIQFLSRTELNTRQKPLNIIERFELWPWKDSNLQPNV